MKNSEKLNLTRKELLIILFVLATALSNLFSIDMYLPSLPSIEQSLHVNQAAAQYTVSIYLLGMAISVLFFGPLSDKTGRKSLILLGLFLNVIGSIFCFKAPTIHALLAGRLIQGIGAGASMGAIRAVISDSFTSKRLAIIAAYFGTLMAISPVMAPVVGGYIETYFGWRANFIALGVYYVLVLVWGLFIPETNQTRHLHSFHYKHHLKNYWHLLRQPTFLTFTFCGGFAVAVSMAYATSGPFIFQKTLGLTPLQFGWIGIFVGLGNILGKLLTPSIVKRYNMEKTLVFGLASIFIAGLILGIPLAAGILNLAIVITAIMVSMFGQGLALANALALGVSPYRQMGGTANALWTFMQMGLSFLVSLFLSSFLFKIDQALGLTSAYIGIGILTLLVYFAFKKAYTPNS